jgi:hypothetical protein
MKDQIVAVDQAANIGIQFQGKRPSGPAFIIWSIPTKRTLADAAGKAHGKQLYRTYTQTKGVSFSPQTASGHNGGASGDPKSPKRTIWQRRRRRRQHRRYAKTS